MLSLFSSSFGWSGNKLITSDANKPDVFPIGAGFPFRYFFALLMPHEGEFALSIKPSTVLISDS